MEYRHNKIEKKWQKKWEENNSFKTNLNSVKPKIYILDMFPYPSGSGLHIGHLEGYTATDIFSRFKRFQGFEVLHPMGWDAFGLPAEQYALQTGNSPKDFTKKNIINFKKQIKSLGFSYDFSKEINTTDPNYYKTTQWIFSKLFEKGLAELKEVEVNWCEKLGTILANEEIIIKNEKMVSERGEHPVIKKEMKQWVLKITNYASKLLKGLEELDWPESVKNLQINWIGKSEGVEIKFCIKNMKKVLNIFTTQPKTILGATYIAIAPENKVLKSLFLKQKENELKRYIKKSKTKTEIQRKKANSKMSGIFTGLYAINPITKKEIPIWVSDYVLNHYATGMVMGVPNFDERDRNFATYFNLEISNEQYKKSNTIIKKELINKGIATEKTYFKLKDWLFSRQRYWGEPIPIIHTTTGPKLVKDFPVILPELKNITPNNNGLPALSKLEKWVNTPYGKRELNTMPQWAGSCWYYIGYLLKTKTGYLDINSKKAKLILNKWLPVDLYIGGQEHAVLHLLYARFWHLFLYDLGILKIKEPFKKLYNQGMIFGKDGTKMSKSKGNVLNPNNLIEEFGADAIRLTEMFLGDLQDDKNWSNETLFSQRKWLERVYRLIVNYQDKIENSNSKELEYEFHSMVNNVTNYIENLKFNLAISELMIFVNKCYVAKKIYKNYIKDFIIIFSIFAPHLGEELWSIFSKKTLDKETWPNFDIEKTKKTKKTIIIQINGKVRGKLEVPSNTSEENIKKEVKKILNVKKQLKGKKILKEIYIKNKLISFVVE